MSYVDKIKPALTKYKFKSYSPHLLSVEAFTDNSAIMNTRGEPVFGTGDHGHVKSDIESRAFYAFDFLTDYFGHPQTDEQLEDFISEIAFVHTERIRDILRNAIDEQDLRYWSLTVCSNGVSSTVRFLSAEKNLKEGVESTGLLSSGEYAGSELTELSMQQAKDMLHLDGGC